MVLKLDLTMKKISFTIAENWTTAVDERVLSIVRSVWGKLRRISDIVNAERRSYDTGAAGQVKVEIVHDVYIHGWKKLLKMKAKWWPQFRTFCKAFREGAKMSGWTCDDGSVEGALRRVSVGLGACMRVIDERGSGNLNPT